MAEVEIDFGVSDRPTISQQGGDNFTRTGRRKTPVGCERGNEEIGARIRARHGAHKIAAIETGLHTRGHAAYLIESKGERLLILGDAVHAHAVQFARPQVAIEFDSDKKQAVATRKKLFAWAAKEKLLVSGMHLPFPGLGHVRADGKGYAWVPVEYSPLRSK